jgi:peroxiredoxin
MASKNQNIEAIDFTLKDTKGRKVRLSDYRGKQPVVLVFNRSIY